MSLQSLEGARWLPWAEVGGRGYVSLPTQLASLREHWQVVSKVRGWCLQENVSLPILQK